VAVSGPSLTAQGQLISPGELSRAHRDLEGIRNCTQCHRLGQRGIDAVRCLDCHTPLQQRLDAGTGYHATVADQPCSDCHKEHFGREFDLVRFDTDTFDHERTGFALTGAHVTTDCQSCHTPDFITDPDVRRFKGEHDALDRTYLGLTTRCQTCHAAEDPHVGQFADASCETCHRTDEWDGAARFTHDDTAFPLTGQHRSLDCATCHDTATDPDGSRFVRYAGLTFAQCSSCHTDPHAGAFGATCSRCHSTQGWSQLVALDRSSFDHAATGFPLIGAHATLDCSSCHATPARADGRIRLTFIAATRDHTYPRLQVEDCLSCHVDQHAGTFRDRPEGAVCGNCHTQDGWRPVTFGIARHNATTDFPLTGSHLATPCASCHRTEDGGFRFEIDTSTCATCHRDDNPHGLQFADADGHTACADCHGTDGWTLAAAAFDHDQTGFPLTGAHATTACADCHRTAAPDSTLVDTYRGLSTDCATCHAADAPHQGQFADDDGHTACSACHGTTSFRIAAFDHAQTRFPLVGAHESVACQQCHPTETAPDGASFVRYVPLGTNCIDCHGEG
jgi:hypothetical protein